MRRIDIGGQFKKDLKLARKRHLPEEELNKIIWKLANDEPLPSANRDHALHGDYEGTRECHIMPDWLLIYSKENEDSVQILSLIRTGSHSSLF
ncbi:MAG TPA: type II toxin-antitoxin system mRNA interferase toxin, RelE/StbE family [Porphyromonadaceae bacterium]|nr:type II toxin-antitoxin system mRNA interferase toxin, RelE/StbE family [Porphyromonadaceae bacterium]